MPEPRYICRQCARNVAPALRAGASECPGCRAAISEERCRAPAHPSVMRHFGLALGDLWSVIRTGKARTPANPAARPPAQHAARSETSEEERDTPQGKVTLRRTVIEEIEIRSRDKPGS